MYPHRIHLHGPWQRVGEAAKLTLPPGGLAHVEATEPLTLRRPFRWPTPLMPFERLWLIASGTQPLQVLLNDQPLGRHDDPWTPWQRDITSAVQPSNSLTLEVPPGAGVLGPVYLEVRRDVHLTEIRGEADWDGQRPRLRLTARVEGESPRSLSFVLRLNDQEVLYEDILGAASVDVVTPLLDVRRWQPHQANQLHQLDCQLLDPACVLSQHSYTIGFRTVEFVRPGEYRVNGTPAAVAPLAWNEPLDESASLAHADREGRLVVLSHPHASPVAVRPYLWHHPSVLAVVDAAAPTTGHLLNQ